MFAADLVPIVEINSSSVNNKITGMVGESSACLMWTTFAYAAYDT